MDNEQTAVLDRAIAEHTGKQERSFYVRQDAIDEEARTVEVCFASDEPYERWFGYEVLSMDRSAIRASRLDEGVAVLVNHKTDDQVGVSVSWSLGTDRRVRAVLRFGESARAQEIFRDIVTGIRRQISFGYMVHAMRLLKESKNGPSTYIVDDYEPFEISIVPVAADHKKAGVGRAMDEPKVEARTATAPQPREGKKMDENTQAATAPAVDVNKVLADAKRAAEQRVQDIMAIGTRHGMADFAMEHVGKGTSVDEFRAAVLEKMGKIVKVDTTPDIGLSEKEVKRYSFARAIAALAEPGNPRAQEAAAFEIECSRASQEKTKRASQGLQVPHDRLVARRDLTVGTNADGGYLKGTQTMSFIDGLFNRIMCVQMGAMTMPNLVGDVAIPKLTAGCTAYWLAESGEPTETKPTFGQLALSLKTIGAWADISRKLLLQSTPAADAIIENDLERQLALGLDAGALHGSGSSNQPTGIAATSGIGSVAGGTNGLAPALSHIVGLETEVSVDNADVGRLGFLTNAKVRGKLRQTFPNTTGGDTPLWGRGSEAGYGDLLGYRAGVTNQVSSTLTKGSSSGVCSAIFFGNWEDLVIALWGGLDLIVDPFTLSTQGALRVTAFQSCDIGVRNPASFAAMLDALTT